MTKKLKAVKGLKDRTKAELIEKIDELDSALVSEAAAHAEQRAALTAEINEFRQLQANTAIERDAARNQCEGFMATIFRLVHAPKGA